MLKIKDNVDLKELEKFGFLELGYANGVVYRFSRIRGKFELSNLIISSSDRILHYNIMSVKNELDDVVFDLIQAGLVEKVVEE